MQVDFAFLADGVAVRPDGKADYFGVGFDTIWAPEVPARHSTMTLAVRITLTREEAAEPHELLVRLVGDEQDQLAEVSVQVGASSAATGGQGPEGVTGVTANLQLADVVFPRFGIYRFTIAWDGEPARPPVLLSVLRLEQGAGAAGTAT